MVIEADLKSELEYEDCSRNRRCRPTGTAVQKRGKEEKFPEENSVCAFILFYLIYCVRVCVSTNGLLILFKYYTCAVELIIDTSIAP